MVGNDIIFQLPLDGPDGLHSCAACPRDRMCRRSRSRAGSASTSFRPFLRSKTDIAAVVALVGRNGVNDCGRLTVRELRHHRGAAAATQQLRKLDHDLMDRPAWRRASPHVRCLVLAIWRRHNGANNGKILYSRRDAQRDLGCGST